MNLIRSPFSILDKDKREMDYIKGIYKKKIQSEIEERSEQELLEEEIKNQQTLDSLVESDKNWS